MKQKYMIYTLFGLLAANMSWNFVGTTNYGEVNLASTKTIQLDDGSKIVVKEGQSSEETVLNSAGEEITTRTTSLIIDNVEGSAMCNECLIGETLLITTDDQGKWTNLAEELKRIEEKGKLLAQERADKEELDRKAREAAKAKEEACIFEDREESFACHSERVSAIAEELNTANCRYSYEENQKECEALELSYERHLDSIRSYSDYLFDVIEEAKSNPGDKQLSRTASRAQKRLDRLKRSGNPIVRKTFTNILNTEAEFQNIERVHLAAQYNIQQAASTGNPWFGFQAQRLEMGLKQYLTNYNPYQGLQSRVDNNYRGGLSALNVDYYMQRHDALRQAIGLDAIYPQITGGNPSFAGQNAQNTYSFRNFRGEGFVQNSALPLSSPTVPGAVVGQLNLASLPGGPTSPALPAVSIGTRDVTREVAQ
jgi:hypothetical protein